MSSIKGGRSAETAEMVPEARNNPVGDLCDIQDVPGMGIGLFAREDIARGTVVSREEVEYLPLKGYQSVDCGGLLKNEKVWTLLQEDGMVAVIEKHMRVWDDLQNNNPFFATIFERLSKTPHLKHLSDNVNVFITHCILSPWASRPENAGFGCWFAPGYLAMNSSCIGNTDIRHLPPRPGQKTLTITVIATKHISKGEEITSRYCVVLNPLPQRKTMIQSLFGFDCACSVCKKPDADIETAMTIAASAFARFDVLQRNVQQAQPWLLLRYASQYLDQMEFLGIHDHLVQTIYAVCAEFAGAHSDELRANFFMRKCAATDLDPEEAARNLIRARRPSALRGFGSVSKMGLSVLLPDTEIPLGDMARAFMATSKDRSYLRLMAPEVAERMQEQRDPRVRRAKVQAVIDAMLDRSAQMNASALIAEEEADKEEVAQPIVSRNAKKKAKARAKAKEKRSVESDEKKGVENQSETAGDDKIGKGKQDTPAAAVATESAPRPDPPLAKGMERTHLHETEEGSKAEWETVTSRRQRAKEAEDKRAKEAKEKRAKEAEEQRIKAEEQRAKETKDRHIKAEEKRAKAKEKRTARAKEKRAAEGDKNKGGECKNEAARDDQKNAANGNTTTPVVLINTAAEPPLLPVSRQAEEMERTHLSEAKEEAKKNTAEEITTSVVVAAAAAGAEPALRPVSPQVKEAKRPKLSEAKELRWIEWETVTSETLTSRNMRARAASEIFDRAEGDSSSTLEISLDRGGRRRRSE